MKDVPDFKIFISSERDFKNEGIRIGVMGTIDDKSLKFIYGNVRNIVHVTSNLRLAILQILCIKGFYKEEEDTEK